MDTEKPDLRLTFCNAKSETLMQSPKFRFPGKEEKLIPFPYIRANALSPATTRFGFEPGNLRLQVSLFPRPTLTKVGERGSTI